MPDLGGDLTRPRSGLIAGLWRLPVAGGADVVKARFGRGGGCVTEPIAKPMLKVPVPGQAHLGQPLDGIVAVRRSLLQHNWHSRLATALAHAPPVALRNKPIGAAMGC